MCIGWRDLEYPQIVCPECEGYGYVETLIGLTYSGNVMTQNRTCEVCKGEGFIIDEKESEE